MNRYTFNVQTQILDLTDKDIPFMAPGCKKSDCLNAEVLEIYASDEQDAYKFAISYIDERISNLNKQIVYYDSIKKTLAKNKHINASIGQLRYGNVEDFKSLKYGDIIQVEGFDYMILVLGTPFYNNDADEPGWEVETDNGNISIYNDITLLGHTYIVHFNTIDKVIGEEEQTPFLVFAKSLDEARREALKKLNEEYDVYDYEITEYQEFHDFMSISDIVNLNADDKANIEYSFD